MRHRNHSHRLSQKPSHAKMMLRSMLTSMLLHEQIRTTKKRATVLKPMVDEIITIGKTDRADTAIRRINEVVTHPNACRKIMEVFIKRYEGRNSGFTSMKAVGMREGDGAEMVDLVLVEGKEVIMPEVMDAPVKKSNAPKAPKAEKPKKAKKTSDTSVTNS